jgi:hypothetical protein
MAGYAQSHHDCAATEGQPGGVQVLAGAPSMLTTKYSGRDASHYLNERRERVSSSESKRSVQTCRKE